MPAWSTFFASQLPYLVFTLLTLVLSPFSLPKLHGQHPSVFSSLQSAINCRLLVKHSRNEECHLIRRSRVCLYWVESVIFDITSIFYRFASRHYPPRLILFSPFNPSIPFLDSLSIFPVPNTSASPLIAFSFSFPFILRHYDFSHCTRSTSITSSSSCKPKLRTSLGALQVTTPMSSDCKAISPPPSAIVEQRA